MQRFVGILFMLISVCCNAQTPSIVPYSRDYEFKEGVFLTILQFKNNSPILKKDIVSMIPKSQVDFMSQMMSQNTFSVIDSSGSEQKIDVNTVWGYAQNRTIYINFNKEFNRLNVIGSLCLFSGMVARTPLRSEPISDMYAIEPVFNELQQFVLDTQTGKVFDFNVQNMEFLLKNDTALYSEFMKLKKRAKADSIFIYLRKYNEKYPFYLPAN